MAPAEGEKKVSGTISRRVAGRVDLKFLPLPCPDPSPLIAPPTAIDPAPWGVERPWLDSVPKARRNSSLLYLVPLL